MDAEELLNEVLVFLFRPEVRDEGGLFDEEEAAAAELVVDDFFPSDRPLTTTGVPEEEDLSFDPLVEEECVVTECNPAADDPDDDIDAPADDEDFFPPLVPELIV